MGAVHRAVHALRAVPLTRENFGGFGDVIEATPASRIGMNGDRFERYHDLAQVDTGPATGGRPCISIARCARATSLPYEFNLVERHPLGSQAFMPLAPFRFVVVVARAGEEVGPTDLRAFITNGQQGVNYRAGVWHLPMIALEAGQAFLVVDRGGAGSNCDERILDARVTLLGE